MVPVFKTITHLPPYMGMLMGLAVMWITAEITGGSKEKNTRYHLSPAYALRKIDSPSILFFLGILLCIAALEKIGVLAGMATAMDKSIGNKDAIVFSMGLLSSIVDNVPLMAAAQGMYPLSQFPVDNPLWEFLAYCTGTGGSLLIIGSAAGVAVMGMANVKFVWYLKHISWIALLGYLAGAAVFVLMQHL
jgi:Na+/H+ antiporter NhaD/arsenite permease-like protein